MDSFRNQAIKILQDNDRGNFTIPTNRLYPFQWNWDTAFTALGVSYFDDYRAWKEIKTLLNSQWKDGMIPHIVFHTDDIDYFPGPKEWKVNSEPPTSGHSQPPILSSIVWELINRRRSNNKEQLKLIFKKLFKYHKWYINNRDPNQTGLISIVHPWESGRDNSIDWDIGLDNIKIPGDLGQYKRRDTVHVDKSERPTKEHYDKYMSIVKFGRDISWDHLKIYNDGPFLMSDPGVQFILLRSSKDLLKISKYLHLDNYISEINIWIERLTKGCEKLWNKNINAFSAIDTRTGVYSDAITSASFLCFYAGVGSSKQTSHMLEHLNRFVSYANYGLPSLDPIHKKFDPKCYWRGPSWAIMNYLIAKGTLENKKDAISKKIISTTVNAIELSGFAEYFDPINGRGLGGNSFSWTAAMYLEFLNTKI